MRLHSLTLLLSGEDIRYLGKLDRTRILLVSRNLKRTNDDHLY